MPEDHRATVELLISLPDEQFADVLRRVFGERRAHDPESHHYLGLASWEEDSGRWECASVGYPDPEEYGDSHGPDWGFCQFGECNCGQPTYSNVKNALCPICGAKVYLS